jgi:hypothetical protein
MKAVKWEQIPDEEVRPGVRRRGFGTPEVMLVMNECQPGMERPSALARLRPDRDDRVGHGDLPRRRHPQRGWTRIDHAHPRRVEHYIEPTGSEPVMNLDVFAPAREDYMHLLEAAAAVTNVTLLTLDEVVELAGREGRRQGQGTGAARGARAPGAAARVLASDAHAEFVRAGHLSEPVLRDLADAAGELAPRWPCARPAADEDVADKSAAGQYESVMGVVGAEALRAAVERCYQQPRASAPVRIAAMAKSASRSSCSARHVPSAAGVAFSAEPGHRHRGLDPDRGRVWPW